MELPYFFSNDLAGEFVTLNDTNSRHIVQVLRMQQGEPLHLTNGKGLVAKGKITTANKKATEILIESIETFAPPEKKNRIAISPLKNASRFEWFLEKAAELGISEVIPLICERTQKEHFRYDRMDAITISALLQSKQTWKTVLRQPISFEKFIAESVIDVSLFIAHCLPGNNKISFCPSAHNNLILIGPEGDFSSKEIEAALSLNYQQVSLGNTRLRTETAGIAAATILQIGC